MNPSDVKQARLRLRTEQVIRDDRRSAGRDASHLTFDRGPVAAELSLENLKRHIQLVTATTWTGHPRPLF